MNRNHVAVMALSLLVLGGAVLATEPTVTRPPVPAASPKELAKIVGSGKWVIVEFGGEYCIPCRAMQPLLQELRDTLGDKVIIRNFWIQQNQDVARAHKIMVMPTQVVFNPKGEEVLRHMGMYPLAEFRSALAEKGLS